MCSVPVSTKTNFRRGFALTEIAIVLGIIGLILGAIWVAAADVYRTKLIDDEVTDLTIIVQNIRSLYAMQPAFAETTYTDITLNLVAEGVFPPSFPIAANGYPIDHGGAEIQVMAVPNCAPAGTCDNTQFQISFGDSSQAVCERLAFYMANLGGTSGPMYVYNNTTVGWIATAGGVTFSTVAGCSGPSFVFSLH